VGIGGICGVGVACRVSCAKEAEPAMAINIKAWVN
jgi:hypothetical protein